MLPPAWEPAARVCGNLELEIETPGPARRRLAEADERNMRHIVIGIALLLGALLVVEALASVLQAVATR